jgi:hypothetical protein
MGMTLVEPAMGTPIKGIEMPKEAYWVMGAPAPLVGMKLPRAGFPWGNLHAAGFRHVVSLHPGTPDPAPLKLAFSEQLEDLVGGGPPRSAAAETKKIARAVTATVSALESGQGVVVHCDGGRERSGTVLGCVLRELGVAAEDAIAFLDRVHKARGTPGWPESPWQSAFVQQWSKL